MRLISILFVSLIVITLIITGCGGNQTTTTTVKAPVTTAAGNPIITATTSSATAKPPTSTTSVVPPPTATPPPSTTSKPKSSFTAVSPAVKFNADDIAFLKVNFTGTPSAIANAIKKWQEDNWVFAASVMNYPDVSDPIRWNYFLPGIFTSHDIVHEQVRNGKVYGICFSYAITYASIAEYYGLETRIVSSVSKPSDTDKNIPIYSITGLAEDEFMRLKTKLDKAGLNYGYEAVRMVAQETPTHYWAEVKLDGQWVIMDATQKATGNDTKSLFIDKNDFSIVDWASRDMSAKLDYYQAQGNGREDGNQPPATTAIYTPPPVTTSVYTPPPSPTTIYTPPPVTTTVYTPPPTPYEGQTDDLGQQHRAENIDDFMQGKALVPYFNNAADAYTFCHITGVSQSDLAQAQQGKTAYEEQSGKKLYVVAVLINHDKTGTELATAYYDACGVELDLVVYNNLYSQYNE